jgi:hypothetical protein
MNKRTEELLDTSAAVLICVGVFGAGIWRGAHPMQHANKETEPETRAEEEPVLESLSLESLSLDTGGDAPLDRVARLAGQTELSAATEHSSGGEVLEHQSLAGEQLEGWSVPEPARLPIPTYAPAIMAFGIVLFAMGLATVWYVCVAGSLIFAIAAWRWTGELQGE